MLKVKKALLFFILILMLVVSVFAVSGNIAKAETEANAASENTSVDGEITPRGIYTKLDFYLDGENGQVWASAKNKFTLFSSTVTVIVELYRSDTYQESYQNMMLVAYKSITDLDQGETITATASTEGKQSYWKSRVNYKIDKKAWQEYLSETSLFNANGTIVL